MNEHLNTAARLHAAETARIEAETAPRTHPTETLREWMNAVATGATQVIRPARREKPTRGPREPIPPPVRRAMHWTELGLLTLGALTAGLALMNGRLLGVGAGVFLLAGGFSVLAAEELKDPEMADWSASLLARVKAWTKRK
jgi:hypothetical protein